MSKVQFLLSRYSESPTGGKVAQMTGVGSNIDTLQCQYLRVQRREKCITVVWDHQESLYKKKIAFEVGLEN